MAELSSLPGGFKENKLWKGVFAVSGIMTTLVAYGVLQVTISYKGLYFPHWFSLVLIF